MSTVPQQDYMVWETQGAVANRTAEHLSFGDRGVVLLRNVLRENIKRVQQGLDPLGLVRDPNLAMIDTNLDESIEMERRGRPVPGRNGSSNGGPNCCVAPGRIVEAERRTGPVPSGTG